MRSLKHKDVILEYLYLDHNYELRHKKDGYLNRYKAHDLVTSYEKDGYQIINIPTKRTCINRSHAVAILSGLPLKQGMQIDHIDGNRSNDHPSNLRVVDIRGNNCNRKKRSDNTSGITGIRWSDYHQHYVIRRTVNGKRLSRSRKTLEEAIKVLDELTKMDSSYTGRHGK